MKYSVETRLLSLRNLKLGSAITSFFVLKFGFGLALISLSSSLLAVSEFVVFSQLFLLFALLSTIAAAGVQNGLAREVAVAQGNLQIEQKIVTAALRIWLVVSFILWIFITLFRDGISTLLVGDGTLSRTIPILAMAGLGGGFGVLVSAILNGRQRAPTSLMLQSIGLVVGGICCIWRLNKGDAVGAALGYSAGPLITTLLSAILVKQMDIRLSPLERCEPKDTKQLLGYSAAFLAIAVAMPTTLFILRFVYRESFGTDALAYWLAANRVSDVTSQILGLYMAQIFLPQVAREEDPHRIRRLLTSTLLLCSVVMFAGWAVFMAGADFFVSTFFSASYLAAIPFISGYLLGDAVRVSASLALHVMLARGRLVMAVLIEWGTVVLLTFYVLLLSSLGYIEAPYWAYPAAYASIAACFLVLLVCRALKSAQSSLKE